MKKNKFPYVGELKYKDLCMYGRKIYKVVDQDPFVLMDLLGEAAFVPAFQHWVQPIPLSSPGLFEINGFEFSGDNLWTKRDDGVTIYCRRMPCQPKELKECTFLVEIEFPEPYDMTICITEIIYLHQLQRLFDMMGLFPYDRLVYNFDSLEL